MPILPKQAPCLIVQRGDSATDETVTKLLHPFARVRSVSFWGRLALEITPIFPVRVIREQLAKANIPVLG